MNSDHDLSTHEVGSEGSQFVAQKLGSDEKDFKEWFQMYTVADGNWLTKDSDVIQVVNSDELDADFVEQRIRESTPEALVTKGFCAKCQDLFDDWPTLGPSSTRGHDSKPEPDENGYYHTIARSCSTFELEGSTRSGCRFCTFLLQSFKDNKTLDIFRKIEARLDHLKENALLSLSIQHDGTSPSQNVWLNLPGKVSTSRQLVATEGVIATLESYFHPASADCHDNPLDVLDIARNWLSTCSENHEHCKSNDDGTLPTRLISISGESPRLVLTSERPKRPRYATLSHSWGSRQMIQLTSEELDSFMKVIPVERLPKTFKDAIKIAQRLGLDYLWIDSLCIIQNSDDDWQKESALMGSVYSGSTINIAASSSRDSSQGCFLKPPNFSGGLRARVTHSGQQRVQDFRSPEVYNLSTFATHLGSRGWALQEKMLPPRTIHFSDRGAFWECRTTIASEYLPDGFPSLNVSPLVRREGKFEELWPQIVQLYSATNLTFGKDKLPALSGIARHGYNETGDQYLAGLWRAQLEEQLCWSRDGSKSTTKRPPWRAPTWSWASVDGRVSWDAHGEEYLENKYAHVLDASTTKYGHDPFGQVTSGVIRLACSTMTAGHLGHSKQSDNPEAEEGATIVLDTGFEFPIQIDCLDDDNQKSDRLIHLLPIRGGRTGFSMSGDGWSWEQLVVEGIVLRATGITKGEFSRIGSFKLYNTKSKYERFLQWLEEHGTVTAEAACAEITSNSKNPDERYVIMLV